MSKPEEKTPAQRLATPVQYLPGVGPRRAELFDKLGLHAVKDLLFFFPRDYEDLTKQRAVRELEEGTLQSVRGVIEEIDLRNTGYRPLRTGRAGPGGRRLPAGDLVQPALHAGEARRGPEGGRLRQAETRRHGLGDAPSPPDDPQ